MVAPSVGAVVLVRFPFSDLSASKLRPAVVNAVVAMLRPAPTPGTQKLS